MILQYFSQCLFTYFRDVNRNKFTGLWSNYLNRVVFNRNQDIRRIDSLYNKHFRIAYNVYTPKFDVKNGKPDSETYEGYYLNTFIDKYKLTTNLIFANNSWGLPDPVTNTWNGIVGVVGYDQAEFGVGYISYTFQRESFTPYSTHLGVEASVWVSKYPGKRSPVDNIVKVFDRYTWFALLGSIVLTSFALLGIVNTLRSLGFKQPDNILVLLTPIAILNAEPMPEWFLFSRTRVYSGSIFMLTYALFSTLVVFAFSSNLRAILLSPSYEVPIDTSRQIAENKMYTAVNPGAAWHYKYLLTSSDPYRVRMMERPLFIKDQEERCTVAPQRKDTVCLGDKENVLNYVKNNPIFPKNQPFFYFSKEKIRPYFYSWVVQKNLFWREHINQHILICHQGLQ
ncbi:uncharacterized protein LOC111717785 [Eurytemora carolleeae]|uniref:uncharacterized protein LOC111717785 n=1 Tax=Eurytemora carolleeae TaxID=1294199 RepID=UPI000C78D0B9|nr:uncharacterized protein LOC111717785 [Eurytemora carolleeae]|eukprot:XP_023349000.1 uncharacterized protein LOC111717785 [Eurytemora affinis]